MTEPTSQRSDLPTVDIDLIIATPPQQIILGTEDDFPESVAACKDWFGFEGSSFRIYVQARINGDLRNYVSARQIFRLDIGGHVFPPGTSVGNSLIQSNANLKLGAIVAGGDIHGFIRAQEGDIGRIESVYGSIDANIQAVAGNIDLIQALGSTQGAGIISSNVCAAKKIKQVFARRIEKAAAAFTSCPDGCCNAQFVAKGTGSIPGSGTNYDYAAIDQIAAAETIGTQSALVTIKTDAGPDRRSDTNEENYNNGGITLIRGGSIYADIETPIPSNTLVVNGVPPYSGSNKRGDIVRIATNDTSAIGSLTVSGAGVLGGSVKTFSLGFNTNNQTPSLDMWGQLQAELLLDGTFKQPVKIRGGVASGATVSLLEQDLASDNIGIEITGDMAGRIEIEGNKDAPITVIGNVSGAIEVGKSVRGAPAANRDYGGRILIDNGSLTPSGTIEVGGTIIDTPSRTEIEIEGDLSGKIKIGKSLAGQINIGTAGLKGQVIINQSNGTGANLGTWTSTGVVKVGSTELKTTAASPNTAPYYSRVSTDLGGGAVGLAPFHLYDEDCTPPNGQIASTQGIPAGEFFQVGNVPVVVRHYGPIKLNTAVATTWDQAVIVEAEDPLSCTFNDSVDDMFVVQGPGVSGWTDPRGFGLLKPAYGQPKGGIFRITFLEGAIVSADVDGEPAVVWDTLSCNGNDLPGYEFRILGDCDLDGIADFADDDFHLCDNSNSCAANYSADNAITVQDIFSFLAVYFAQNPCADINNSGTVSVQDIFDFLGAYFSHPAGQLCDETLAPDC